MNFTNKAKQVHGDKYDYSLVEYKNNSTKVKIICPVHGVFEQRPADHTKGAGCKKCGVMERAQKKKINIEEAKNRAKFVHGEFYDYTLVSYSLITDKVKIICPKHGVFEQNLLQHINGSGCPKCSISKRASQKRMTKNDFIERARKIHGPRYNYDHVRYVNTDTKVKIICYKHGVFKQTPYSHMVKGCGCPKCGLESRSDKRRLNVSEFTERALAIHGEKYDYSLVEYHNNSTRVKIICPEHGVFEQTPNDHTDGHSCPKCGYLLSKAEEAICELLNQLGVEHIRGDRTLIKPYELDIYIPSNNIAIEYNGLVWHSEKFGKDKNYHINKTKMCQEKGVRLIHIWEDDFNRNQERELRFITYQLGLSKVESVYARKTLIKFDIDKNQVKDFLEQYHVQGQVNYSTSISLFTDDVLVAVGCFTKRGEQYELVRYCSSINVVGGLGKVVKALRKPCYTFCDNSRFTGDSYLKAGFVNVGDINPDYKYLVDSERQHKFVWRRKSIAAKLPEIYSDELSEREMMEKAGIPRVWDCGKTRFEYKPS